MWRKVCVREADRQIQRGLRCPTALLHTAQHNKGGLQGTSCRLQAQARLLHNSAAVAANCLLLSDAGAWHHCHLFRPVCPVTTTAAAADGRGGAHAAAVEAAAAEIREQQQFATRCCSARKLLRPQPFKNAAHTNHSSMRACVCIHAICTQQHRQVLLL